jgi:hypothetical protein
MANMDESEPKMQLPETWAAKMSCPVCASRPLGVFHPTGHADRFVCQSCETSFELENIGTRVRFVTLPQGITPWMRAKWISLDEALAAFAAHQNETSIFPAVVTPSPAPVESAVTPIDDESISEAGPAIPASEIESDPAEAQFPKMDEYAETWEPADTQDANPVDQPLPAFMTNVFPPTLSTDISKAEKPVTSPFYEDDIEIPGIYPDRIKSEFEKPADEVWKNLEDERVRNSLLQPAKQIPDFMRPVADVRPVELDSNIPPAPESEFPTTLAGSVSLQSPLEEPIDLDNPPPLNPVDDTPASPLSFARSLSTSEVANEDLGDIRTQIVRAGNAPTVNERIQSASQRALELQRLGNSDNEVRSILERSSGLTPEQVADVLKGLEKPEEKKRGSRLLMIFSVVAIIIFTLIAWIFLTSRPVETPEGQPPAAQPTAASEALTGQIIEPESLPAPLQTIIPDGVRIFNDPITVQAASNEAIPPTTCPQSKTAAAALFGGPAEDWTMEDQKLGWILVSQQQSLEIKVPANMSAGYLVFERGPEMRSVVGPAIVSNIYMITISCQ